MTGSITADEPFRLSWWGESYAPGALAFDELLDRQGGVRPAWSRFIRGIDELGAEGLAQRAEHARRLLRENGVTYNLYGAPQGPNRPWELDPLPLLIDKGEWTALAESLAQRARLLNATLADLYGPQRLLSSGVVPPELVFGSGVFLVPAQGVSPPRDVYLHLYAAHLARQPDGRWVTLADRTQGPSGAGYAVENRIVISRTLPHDFHSLHVERLAGFFLTLRDTLRGLAPRPTDNPRIVLLSPGARSATYFEDTYLARYLGYTLAEGADLTVRGTSVYLKTLGGLLPVDVILRRVLDEDCDPLELRGDSLQGVPGLLQAVRSGQVVVANALGSGWLESPAFMAFLPAICRCLLGEDLRLPSVPTWWCGDEGSRRYVLGRIDRLIVRPAFHHRTARPIVCRELSAVERETLVGRIQQRPGDYVAQEEVTRSTAPTWSAGALQPWHIGLRAFAAARGDGYEVMPGGLSRVSSMPHGLGEAMGAGQGSKDVWILSDRPVTATTLLPSAAPTVELRRSVNDLPSRVADNLYWVGRLVERAEGWIRHLRSAVVRLTSELEPGGVPELVELVRALIEPGEGPLEPSLAPPDEALDPLPRELIDFVFNPERSDALALTLASVRRTATTVRDRLSVDGWRIINQLDLEALYPWPPERAKLGDLLLLLNQLLTLLAAFSGLGMESMTRGPGWRFLDIGRRLERALHMIRLLRRTVVRSAVEQVTLLEMLLEIADSTMTYRYRYLTTLQLPPVLDLLVLDDSNPRAVAFQLAALAEHVRRLPLDRGHGSVAADEALVVAARAALRLSDVDAWCEVDEQGVRRQLDQALAQLTDQLYDLSDTLTAAYFAHVGPTHALITWPGEGI